MRLEVCGCLCAHFVLASISVDPDLFDGRTYTRAMASTNAAKRDSAIAASDANNGNLSQAQAPQAVDEKAAKMKQPADTAAQTRAANLPSAAAQELDPAQEELPLPAAAQSADSQQSVGRKFEAFAVGAGTRRSLPEKSSKQVNVELDAGTKDRAEQSSQAATRGAQRSADLKSINRDRGTDLPTNL
ncbi:MAG: hypothetical protein ACPGF8_03985 [Opitutales bacterium]